MLEFKVLKAHRRVRGGGCETIRSYGIFDPGPEAIATKSLKYMKQFV